MSRLPEKRDLLGIPVSKRYKRLLTCFNRCPFEPPLIGIEWDVVVRLWRTRMLCLFDGGLSKNAPTACFSRPFRPSRSAHERTSGHLLEEAVFDDVADALHVCIADGSSTGDDESRERRRHLQWWVRSGSRGRTAAKALEDDEQ